MDSRVAKALRLLVSFLVVGFLITAAQGTPTTTHTNVLLMIADDLGLTLGCYGDTQARTPTMDKLAAEGARFVTAYVTQSSCSPSRSSIYTGLFPHQNGQTNLAHTPGFTQMRPDVKTLPGLLKGTGYRTGLIGKFHVKPTQSFPWDKLVEGKALGGNRDGRNFARETEAFLRETGDQPFCLVVAFTDPHRPLMDQVEGVPPNPVSPNNIKPLPFVDVNTSAVRQETAGYYNCVTRVDTGMGMVLDKLQAAGHMDDTMVIVIGDNGPPFTRGKTTCYEAGLRTPFLVRCPGKAKPGMVSEALLSTVDILPTILDLAGQPIPKDLAGASILPLLQGDTSGWRKTLCGEFTAHVAPAYFPRRAIRDARYKLIHNLIAGQRTNPVKGIDKCSAYAVGMEGEGVDPVVHKAYQTYDNPPEWELYDLDKDPVEFHNLAADPEYATIRKRLTRQLGEWQEATDDPVRTPAGLSNLTRDFAKRAKAKRPKR